MSKWDYTIRAWERSVGNLTVDEERALLNDLLNEMGESGWELVHFKPAYLQDKTYTFTIWKRQRD
jgi:hypothetical protein